MLCALEATLFPLGSEVRVQRTGLSGEDICLGSRKSSDGSGRAIWSCLNPR